MSWTRRKLICTLLFQIFSTRGQLRQSVQSEEFDRKHSIEIYILLNCSQIRRIYARNSIDLAQHSSHARSQQLFTILRILFILCNINLSMVVNIQKWTQLFYHLFWLFVSISYRNHLFDWRKQLRWLIFSGCNERSWRWWSKWRPDWKGIHRGLAAKQKPLCAHGIRQRMGRRPANPQPEIQRLSKIGPEHFNASDRFHSHNHNEPRVRWILFHSVLPVHVLEGVQVWRDEPVVSHPHPIPRIWIRIDVIRDKIHERFLQQWTRCLKTEIAP